ncbi:glutamate 5-kinase [Haliovirga abyssi]|uniref:Glutamate 5-kinase n=1 Tax=Haliovirga abyssi TaxID=2996794 RepID=A0AAU9D2M7_9FUSO|nr:glutamate 5-kinase [Haliovirga abyssi]BDU50254.1 glutamate 5-kinase [Haliovirga abyssi]
MNYKRVVIKIGSSNLVRDGKVDDEKIKNLIKIISKFKKKDNIEFIIVSSGAVAVGKEKVGISSLKLNIRQKQAMAAIGQPYLMRKYKENLENNNILGAQVLLTSDDLHNRTRLINARDTLLEILHYNAVPIINENDTVSTEEIKIGDNDNLSARVAAIVDAELLIILSDIDGLYNKNPKNHNDAVLIKEVFDITKDMKKNAGGAGSKVGTGGMITKLEAAEVCMKFNVEMVIINGNSLDNIVDILNGKQIGTKFSPNKKKISKKKLWIGYGARKKGEIYIDKGAYEALNKGKSLLSGGIVGLSGKFKIGDSIKIFHNKEEIARGLTNYSSDELLKIKGKKSYEIDKILGYKYQDEIVHRNNMILI